jgi:hypothetical protein
LLPRNAYRYSTPLQNGAGDTAAFVVATLNTLGFGTRGLGRLDDGLGDRSGSAAGTAAVVETLRGTASHFGDCLELIRGEFRVICSLAGLATVHLGPP